MPSVRYMINFNLLSIGNVLQVTRFYFTNFTHRCIFNYTLRTILQCKFFFNETQLDKKHWKYYVICLFNMMFWNILNRFQNVDRNLALFGQILGKTWAFVERNTPVGVIYRVKQFTFQLQKFKRVLKLSKYWKCFNHKCKLIMYSEITTCAN
jgi:hypothetical protein